MYYDFKSFVKIIIHIAIGLTLMFVRNLYKVVVLVVVHVNQSIVVCNLI